MRGYSDVSGATTPSPAHPILKEIYRYIENFIAQEHYPPTIFEIAGAFGLRADAARRRLLEMERLGWIVRDGRKRSIVLKGMK